MIVGSVACSDLLADWLVKLCPKMFKLQLCFKFQLNFQTLWDNIDTNYCDM